MTATEGKPQNADSSRTQRSSAYILENPRNHTSLKLCNCSAHGICWTLGKELKLCSYQSAEICRRCRRTTSALKVSDRLNLLSCDKSLRRRLLFRKIPDRNSGLDSPDGITPNLRSNKASLRLDEAALRRRSYPFSSDQGSQTGLGSTSTRLTDRPGTLSAVVFCPCPILAAHCT